MMVMMMALTTMIVITRITVRHLKKQIAFSML